MRMKNSMYIFFLGALNNSYIIPFGVPNCKSMLLRIVELYLERLLSYQLRYNYSTYNVYNPTLNKFSSFIFLFVFWKWKESIYSFTISYISSHQHWDSTHYNLNHHRLNSTFHQPFPKC